MKGTITINDKSYEAVANAASPYLYRQIFGEDFLLAFDPDNPKPELFEKMFFVMVKQEELGMKACLKLTTADYYEWLMEFEPMDIMMEIDQISSLYFANTKGIAIPKNEAG